MKIISKNKFLAKNPILNRIISIILLLVILLSFGSIFIPQLAANLFLQATLIMPLSKSVFTSNSSICDGIQTQILRLNPIQMETLVDDLLPYIQDWPAQVNQRYQNNTFINMTTKLLSTFEIGQDEGPRGARNCYLGALKNLQPYSAKALPDILKIYSQMAEDYNSGMYNLIVSLVQNNKATIPLIKEALLTEKNAKTNRELWSLIRNVGEKSHTAVFELFEKSSASDLNETASVQEISQELYQLKELPKYIREYILDSSKPTSKRLLLLGLLAQGNYQLVDNSLIESLINDPVNEIRNQIQFLSMYRPINSQSDLDFYFKMRQNIFTSFDLTKREDWKKLEEIIKFLYDLNSKVGHLNSNTIGTLQKPSLNFSKIIFEVQKVLNTVARQIGYQSESFNKLTFAVASLQFANYFSSFYEQLLNKKAERNIAIRFFIRLGSFPQSTSILIAKQLKIINDQEKIEALQVLSGFSNHVNNPGKDIFGDSLRQTFFDFLNHKNEKVIALSLNLLAMDGEAILPNIRKRMSSDKKSSLLRLNLAQLQWKLSSTSQSFQQLQQELKNYGSCDYTYANSFSMLLSRQSDSTPETKGNASGNSQGAAVLYNNHIANFDYEHFTLSVEPVYKVASSPPEFLLEKFLGCEIKYLPALTISNLAKYSDKIKTIILNFAKKSNETKKKFLMNAVDLNQRPTDNPNIFFNPEGPAAPGPENSKSQSEPSRGI